MLVGILTLGAGLGGGLGLTSGPVTVTDTVMTGAILFGVNRRVTEYVYHHQDDQNVQVEEMRLFDKMSRIPSFRLPSPIRSVQR